MTRNKYAILLAILIVSYGTFGKLFWPTYQFWIESLLQDQFSIHDLKVFLSGTREGIDDQYALGRYFLYYPGYLTLHVLLIMSLFPQRSHRLIAVTIFFSTLFSLAGSSLIFYFLDLIPIHQGIQSVLLKALDLPIILFFIEGGRLLIRDIDMRLIHKGLKN